jgi:hypothetical protein
MIKVTVGVLVALLIGVAHSGEFRTHDPLKAFVYEEYPLGDDYFIHGNDDTYIFRCVLMKRTEGFEGIALSEISIWGNHGGPWEVFRKEGSGGYFYIGTKGLATTSCLESCRSKDYLATGQCRWQRGWPKQ